MTEPLLKVRDLSIRFDTPRGLVHAVNNVSFDLMPGQTMAVVGESGSGKSVLSRAILRLLPEATTERSGQVLFDGTDLTALTEKKLRNVRGKDIAMIFQDPMSSLNPVLTIEQQIGEVLELHLGLDSSERKGRTIELLRSVGIAAAEQRMKEYPHQLSGGMRQRVMIAMALACRPRLLIADEPTTALDVTIQMQILVLLKRQQRETGMAMIFISHDLAAVGGIADEVVVMYGGRFVEQAPTDAFFKARHMPYSEALLKARPDPFAPRGARLQAIAGRPPDLTALPKGCSFAARCSRVQPDCRESLPPFRDQGNRRYACFHPILNIA
ncbi:peptide ABC transporter ATP-binding protein [Afipia sp. P52-10]|uniref:ABC transporter ATP-binding protein n=1 Tax=Afipia sp. P52-10 TaxID=1429916 RepID=UPI0003DEF93A|nr:ABC transporter ATP-binding protein [Afipia sp. P52-10]ETR76198.1 peptide ABC transporter ATP-binding protein [Afipia sp. P52-10]